MNTIPYPVTHHNLGRHSLRHAAVCGISGIVLTYEGIPYFLQPEIAGLWPVPEGTPLVVGAPVEGPMRETLAAEFAHRLWTTGGAA